MVLSIRREGHIEDSGRFPGLVADKIIRGSRKDRRSSSDLMKLLGLGGTPKKLVMFGAEKSSISSLRRIPVLKEC